jgi:hypothetical protein
MENSKSLFTLVKAEDYSKFGLQLPVITLFGDESENKYFSADAVKRKIGEDHWREMAAKHVSLLVESDLLVEDFDAITNF